jgi:hypothetical protein
MAPPPTAMLGTSAQYQRWLDLRTELQRMRLASARAVLPFRVASCWMCTYPKHASAGFRARYASSRRPGGISALIVVGLHGCIKMRGVGRNGPRPGWRSLRRRRRRSPRWRTAPPPAAAAGPRPPRCQRGAAQRWRCWTRAVLPFRTAMRCAYINRNGSKPAFNTNHRSCLSSMDPAWFLLRTGNSSRT